MAYTPIQKTLPQYVDVNGDPYSGAVLKAYAEGTSTNISFATDSTGATTAASLALNASGYPELSGAEVIPYLDQNYKLALYPTQAAADSDTGSIWIIDNIVLNSVDLAGNEITGVGNGTARTSATNVAQVQDSTFISLGTTAGAADAYTLAPAVPITAYASTQFFIAKIHATNTTTTPYLQISSIATPASNAVIQKLDATAAEIAVEANDLLNGGVYFFKRNADNDSWIVLNPELPYIDGTNFTNLVAAASETVAGVIELATAAEIATGTDTGRAVTPANQAYTLISTATASTSSEITFTGLSSTYAAYKIIITDVVPATDNVSFYLRTSTDNGSSYDSGASDYVWNWRFAVMGSSAGDTGDAADSFISLGSSFGSDTNEAGSHEITLFNPSSTAYTRINFDNVASDINGAQVMRYGSGVRLSAADVDAIQFIFSSGNIESGTFKLYGIKA